jgi:hypothetical protein
MSTTINKKRLRVTELDFDDIKENLKVFLKEQEEFKDYDFEGAGINILLDTLAYNTHYLGYNDNIAINEMFLDSASLRSSIVSHAKHLGYEVQSARAAKATISVSVKTDSTSITMPAGTAFSTTFGGVDYNFVTVNDIINYKDTPLYHLYDHSNRKLDDHQEETLIDNCTEYILKKFKPYPIEILNQKYNIDFLEYFNTV